MLALDDGAMCRVLLAASAIPPAELCGWLERLAVQFEQMPRAKLSRSAMYTRRYRDRLKAGKVVLRHIVVDEAALVAGLVGLRLLDPLRADDRNAVAAAAGRALEALCEASRHDGEPHDRIRLGLCLSALQKRNAVKDYRADLQRRFARTIETDLLGKTRPVDTDEGGLSQAAGRTSASVLSIDDLAEVIGDALKTERHKILDHVQRLHTLIEIRLRDEREKNRVDRIARRVTQIEAELRIARKNRDGIA